MFLAIMCVPFLYLLWPSLLLKKDYEQELLIATAIIAVVGVLLFLWLHATNCLSLLCPLYALLVFKAGSRFFRKRMRRDPKQPPKSLFLDDEYNWDRLFQFCYLLLTFLAPLCIFIGIFKWP